MVHFHRLRLVLFITLAASLLLLTACSPVGSTSLSSPTVLPSATPLLPTTTPPPEEPQSTPTSTSSPTSTASLPSPTATPVPSPTPEAQASSEETWIKPFEGPEYGAFLSLTRTPGGNILVVGATNHLHMPPYSGDALFIEMTLAGVVLWEQAWGAEGYEQALAVAPAEDGGYLVFGETDSYGAGNRDFFLLKITAEGSPEWVRTYGGTGREWPYGMLELENGELLVYGFSESPAGGRDVYALRLTQEGDVLWEFTVEKPGEELILDALETAEGDLILAVNVEEDGQLTKLNAKGALVWEKRYELPGWQYASSISKAEAGQFLLLGFSMSPDQQADTWIAMSTPDGELAWEKSFGEPAFDDYGVSLIRLQDGNYLVGAIGNGMILSKVDQDGNVLWRQSLLDPNTVYGGMALAELEEGGFLVAGLVQIIGGRSYDAVIIRTDFGGNAR